MDATRQPLGAPQVAFVRPVPARYVDCLREHPAAINLERARGQWTAYRRALVDAGAQVVEVPADNDLPDACFVEDTAVLLAQRALVTHPGAPSRVAEVAAVADVLGEHYHVEAMEAPATLEGGDVLRWQRELFVGLSRRTNRAGIDHLTRIAERDGFRVHVVPVFSGLHLKSACTLADGATLLIRPDVLDAAPFREHGLECVPAPEPLGANVLALGNVVLVSTDAPRTADLLTQRGLTVRTLDVSELHKGDAGLTCLSLRMSRAGHWST